MLHFQNTSHMILCMHKQDDVRGQTDRLTDTSAIDTINNIDISAMWNVHHHMWWH